jgi:hypothetical protein
LPPMKCPIERIAASLAPAKYYAICARLRDGARPVSAAPRAPGLVDSRRPLVTVP